MKKYIVLVVILISIGTICFSSGNEDLTDKEIVQINADELKQLMVNKNFTLINVHIPLNDEIPGTDLSIPYNKIENNIDILPGKNEQIIIYCKSGGMSKTAYRKLVELGYQNILELDGGYNAWRRAGYELTTN